MLGTRLYTLCSLFRANAHNSSLLLFHYNLFLAIVVVSVVCVSGWDSSKSTLSITDQDDFDLSHHLNSYSGESDGADNPLLCLSGSSLYHDVPDTCITLATY